MPDRPVVLANESAGPSSTAIEELDEVFADLAEVRPIGDDLVADVEKAVEGGAPWVGVAGGDGSLRAAAGVLVAADRPLLAVPCGTKNHFALAVGTETIEKAVEAARGGHTRAVDVGWVGEEIFLNTASLGTYAAVVRERDIRAGWPKRLADAVGVVRQGFRSDRYEVLIDGKRRRVWELFAGNGEYGDTLQTIGEREDMRDGVLDLRVILAEHKLARLRLLGALMASSVGRTPVLEQQLVEEVDVELCGAPTALIALDGDAHKLPAHTRWRVAPKALRVVVPSAQV